MQILIDDYERVLDKLLDYDEKIRDLELDYDEKIRDLELELKQAYSYIERLEAELDRANYSD
jgi:predicted RNase H-like nuclease (RuvC/YqgF family)